MHKNAEEKHNIRAKESIAKWLNLLMKNLFFARKEWKRKDTTQILSLVWKHFFFIGK